MNRRSLVFLIGALVVAMALGGCSNPYKRKAKAEADVAEQKAKMMADYRKCLDKYGKTEPEKCEGLRKATEGL